MKKKPTIAKLKKKLTIEFNKFIRLRDLGDDKGRCISCNQHLPLKGSHAGHFIPSTYSPVRFDERNVNGQCAGCNTFKHGNLIEYRPNLIAKIGLEAVEELEQIRNDYWKWDRFWLEEKIEHYKEKIKEFK